MGMLLARRIQILRLLDRGWTLKKTAETAGTYPREVRRVARRYSDGGVERGLSDESRRAIVQTISRETVRRVLEEQDIKPWREKNVVRARDR